MTDIDLDAIDYFRTDDLTDDPYPYLDHSGHGARSTRSRTTTSTW